VAEEAVHVVLAVFFLHDHERGILGESFCHHVGALHVTADQLMSPPLVAEFVRSHEIGEVDVIFLDHVLDKADSF